MCVDSYAAYVWVGVVWCGVWEIVGAHANPLLPIYAFACMHVATYMYMYMYLYLYLYFCAIAFYIFVLLYFLSADVLPECVDQV